RCAQRAGCHQSGTTGVRWGSGLRALGGPAYLGRGYTHPWRSTRSLVLLLGFRREPGLPLAFGHWLRLGGLVGVAELEVHGQAEQASHGASWSASAARVLCLQAWKPPWPFGRMQ